MGGPWHRELQIAFAYAQDIVDLGHAAGPQDPSDLGEQPGLDGDVPADLQQVGAIEAGGAEGQRERARLS